MTNLELIPPLYRNSALAHELGMGVWKKVFSVILGDDELPDEEFTIKLVKAFIESKDKVPSSLVEFLRVLNLLGDRDGRTIVEQALADSACEFSLADTSTDKEIAANLWLESQVSHPIRQVLLKALGYVEFLHKTTNLKEYSSNSSFALPKLEAEKIQTRITDWCEENQKSGVVELSPYEVDGIWYCNIIRGDAERQQAVIEGSRLTNIRFKPAAFEHIRVDPETGRIGIVSRSSKLVSAYRSIIGDLISGKNDFFSGENICSLAVLKEKGESILADDLGSKIKKISLKKLKWQGNYEGTFEVTGKNCFKVLKELNVNLKPGDLVEARLDFIMAQDRRRVSVYIKVPSKIDIPDEKHDITISRFLERVGIKGNFNAPEQKRFWDLYPWKYTESEWNRQIGNEHFNLLRKAGMFDGIDLEAVAQPGVNSHSNNMEVEHLDSGAAVAYSKDVGIRTLTQTDIEGYSLSIEKICKNISSVVGTKGNVEEFQAGIWSVGTLSLSEKHCIKLYFASEKPTDYVINSLQKQINSEFVALIIPSDCSFKTSIPTILISPTSLYLDEVIPEVVKALDLQGEICPSVWLDRDLILHPSMHKAWYKGIELSGVNYVEHPFKFALEVTRGNGEPVQSSHLNNLLSPARDDTSAAKNAKSKFMKKVKSALELVGNTEILKPNAIFSSSNGTYKIACSYEILD